MRHVPAKTIIHQTPHYQTPRSCLAHPTATADDAPPSTPQSTSPQPTNTAATTHPLPYAPASDPLSRVPLYPEELRAAAGPPLTVAVTGATGYVAGAVVARLLAAGHIVHGTVR